jgi:tol-pal system protein YbgF
MNARTSALAAAAVCAAALTLVGCATDPATDPVQIKLNDLETRLTRIERVVSNNSLLDVSNQLGNLQADLRSMHNDIDVLNHALDTSRKQQRDLYADLDQRLKALELRTGGASGGAIAGGNGAPAGATSGAVPAGAAAAGGAAAGGAAAAGAPSSGAADTAPGGASAADTVSYQAAFALLKNGQYDQAVQAFQSFLTTYSTSPLADNAQYWLGEAYYVNKAFPEALAAFQRVVDKYPQSRKVPDALLKVGYCDYELKQYQAAKDVLTQVQTTYGDTPAGQLAKQRLDKMAAEKH